jgi:hypothetical protein
MCFNPTRPSHVVREVVDEPPVIVKYDIAQIVGVHDPYGSIKSLVMSGGDGRLAICWSWPVPNMGVSGMG